MSDSDRIVAARNLAEILERFERHSGRSKANVLRAANIGLKEHSTKHCLRSG